MAEKRRYIVAHILRAIADFTGNRRQKSECFEIELVERKNVD